MQNFAQQHGFASYFETSAKTGVNVTKSIMFLVDEVININHLIVSSMAISSLFFFSDHEE